MIQFILEVIAFQLVFMVVYDFFLKRETFFQWNRAYLLVTFVLSIILPWIKLEILRVSVPLEYRIYPEFLLGLDNAMELKAAKGGSWLLNLSWEYVVLLSGMILAAIVFAYKLLKIQMLRRKGDIMHFPRFTRIIIANSTLAFSFFRSIFLGDKVVEKEHENIIQHELVHIEQRHSLDLIFFEIMRIVGWFNPLVYVYQKRISDLHEYIADATVAKTYKREHYQFLLSQVFQTENISFVNQFFKSSLIKKRILMLQRSKSKKVWKLKYLFLVPVIMGMLIYSSCQADQKSGNTETVLVENIENLTPEEEDRVFGLLREFSTSSEDWILYVKDKNTQVRFVNSNDASYVTGPKGEMIKAKLMIDSEIDGNSKDLGKSNFHLKNQKEILESFYQILDDRNESFNSVLPGDFYEDKVLNEAINQYNKLVLQRQSLLEDSNSESPIIQNLEQQIRKLDDEIGVRTRVLIAKAQEILLNEVLIPFALVDEVPVFPGCEGVPDKRSCFNEKLQRHIQKHFNYPKEAREKGIEGRVNLMFTISKGGSIKGIVFRGTHRLLEEEAERIIKQLPQMQAGIHKGEKVNVPFSIPITFKL